MATRDSKTAPAKDTRKPTTRPARKPTTRPVLSPEDRRHYEAGAHHMMNSWASDLIDALRDVAKDPGPPTCPGELRCSAASEARILRLLGELRQAFRDACVEYVEPELERAGNVVYLPGANRGKGAC